MPILSYLNICHFCFNCQLMIKMDHFNLVNVELKENMKDKVSFILASCGKVNMAKHLVFK